MKLLPGERGEDGFDLFRMLGIVVNPFPALDVNPAMIVNELSGPVKGSRLGGIGADGHHARVLDRAVDLGFVIHKPGHTLFVINPANTAGSANPRKALGPHRRSHCDELFAQLVCRFYRSVGIRI